MSDCGSLLQSAGFSLPTIDQDVVRVAYPNAFALMEDLQVTKQNGGPGDGAGEVGQG